MTARCIYSHAFPSILDDWKDRNLKLSLVYIDLIMHIIGFLNYEEIDYSIFCIRSSLITPRISNK